MARITVAQLAEIVAAQHEMLSEMQQSIRSLGAAVESQESPAVNTASEEPDFDEHKVLNASWTKSKVAKAKAWRESKGLPAKSVLVWHVRSKTGKDSVIFRQRKNGRPSNAVGKAIAAV